MPRQPRLDIPGALYHIMVRGINKTDIFLDKQDRVKFLERLGENIIEPKSRVYVWVLMHHYHTCNCKRGYIEKCISFA